MKTLGLLALVGLLSGCAWFREPPEQGITTGATVVYSGGGFKVFSVCDKGNLVYSSEKNPQVFVVPGGCNPGGPGGVSGPGGPSPAGIAAVTERTPTPAPLVTFPQPFVIHLIPAPPGEAAAPREPIVIQVQPAPAPPPAAPKAAPAPAPKGRTCPC